MLVRAECQHGRRRLALQRRKHRQVLHVAAKQVDHAQRGLARTAVGLYEKRQAFDAADVPQQRIEAGDIALADGAFAGIPVGDDRLAEESDSLSSTGWVRSISIGGLVAAGRITANSDTDYRYRLVRQFGYRSILNCREWLDISTMLISPKQHGPGYSPGPYANMRSSRRENSLLANTCGFAA